MIEDFNTNLEDIWTRYDIYYKEMKIHKGLRSKTFIRLWNFYSNKQKYSDYFWCTGYNKHEKKSFYYDSDKSKRW